MSTKQCLKQIEVKKRLQAHSTSNVTETANTETC